MTQPLTRNFLPPNPGQSTPHWVPLQNPKIPNKNSQKNPFPMDKHVLLTRNKKFIIISVLQNICAPKPKNIFFPCIKKM